MTARGIPFRALFVVGLNEKVFPRAISEDPFLRDHVRRRLSEVLGNLVPEKLRGYDEERLLFYFLLNTARERLYLFFERSDEAGKPKVQSHYLMDFLQNMHGTALKRKERREILHEIYVPRGLKDKLCRKEAELLTPKELCVRTTFQKTDTARCIGMMGVNPVIFNRSLQALTLMERYDSQLTGYDGIVGDMSPWCNKQWSQGVSPTALEVFGACPFRYFMEKTLQLESLEEPENTDMMEAVDIGFLCHAILKDFYDTLIKNGYFRKKQKGIHPLEILRDIATKRFLETERLRPIRHPLLWEIKKEELFAVLSHFVIQDITCIEKTGYVPAYLETVIPLHPQDDLPEAVGRCFRQKEFSGMSLKGKIDRIDIRTLGNMVHYRIIDYKTGKFFKENLVRSAIRGKTMQLPFYIAMAERFISDKMKKGHIPPGRIELDGASFVYITQGNKDKEGDVCLPENAIDRELWVDCGNQCWEAVKEFLEIIRAGLYPVSTQRDSKMCEWCEFTTICRRGHQPLRFRLEHDARLEKYREIINRDIAKKSRKG
jgi:hypothetical protein